MYLELVTTVLVISWMSFIIWKIYRRHKTNMEPKTILEIHNYTEFLLLTICHHFRFLGTIGFEIFSDSGTKIYCWVNNFFNIYTYLCILCSSSILHYEKYQSLKSNHYRINHQRAWDRIISLKIIIFGVTFVGYHLDTAAQECLKTQNPEPTKNHIFWFAVPYFATLYYILKVLRYALKMKMKHKMRKNGDRNLSDAADSIQSISAQVSSIPGPSCFKNTNTVHPSSNKSLEVSEVSEVNRSVMYPSELSDIDEDEIGVLESIFIDQSPNNSEDPEQHKSQENEKDLENNSECEEIKDRLKIVRRGSATDMFYIEPNEEKVIPINKEHIWTLTMVTSIIRKHIQMFTIFLLYFPQLFFKAYVFLFYNFFYLNQNNDANIVFWYKLNNLWSLIVTIVYFSMALLCERT